jgi:hypothetical protein
MATTRWSVAQDGQVKDVVVATGAAVVTANIELTVDTDAGVTRDQVIRALKVLLIKLASDGYPT